jgi:hypothetical protein
MVKIENRCHNILSRTHEFANEKKFRIEAKLGKLRGFGSRASIKAMQWLLLDKGF